MQVVKTRSWRRHQHALVVGRKSDSKIESKQRLVHESEDDGLGGSQEHKQESEIDCEMNQQQSTFQQTRLSWALAKRVYPRH